MTSEYNPNSLRSNLGVLDALGFPELARDIRLKRVTTVDKALDVVLEADWYGPQGVDLAYEMSQACAAVEQAMAIMHQRRH